MASTGRPHSGLTGTADKVFAWRENLSVAFDRDRANYGGMKRIEELQRLDSPAPKPQSLAWDGATLWMCSRETRHVYAIDPVAWQVRWETAAPGTPYGITMMGAELRVVSSETEEDHRILRRCLPYKGFDGQYGIPCPDDCGSQLSFDGKKLHLTQWYPKKLITLGDAGEVERVIVAPHGICGQAFVDGCFYLLTTDNEETTDYWLTRVDPRGAKPKIKDLAQVPFAARGLVYDGARFWTNHREQNQIVSFAKVD